MPPVSHWPPDSGEMGKRIRLYGWSNTPFGPIENWPVCLRCNVETVLSQVFPAALLWGPDLIVCAYNDAYRTLLGKKPDALGKPFLEIWGEAWDVIAPQLQGALEGKGFSATDALFILERNGYPERSYFDYSFSPVRDDEGRFAGVLNLALEVTERVRERKKRQRFEKELQSVMGDLETRVAEQTRSLSESQKKLQRQAKFLDGMMSSLDSPIYVWNREKRFIYANRVLEELWGLEPGDYLGKTMEDLNYPTNISRSLIRQIERVFATGESVTGETDYVSPSGVATYYNYTFSPIAGSDGETELVVGISRDISDRKELEQALERANQGLEEKVRERTEHLRQSEQRYRTLFESIDEGFCIVRVIHDENGTAIDHEFLETNPAFENHTGLKNARGRTARELVPDIEPRWHEIHARVARTGQSEHFVEQVEALNRWFEVDAFRVGEPDDYKVGLLFRDITERKRAEDELLRLLGLIEGITRGSEDLIAAVDSDFRFLYFNEAYRQEFKKLWDYDIREGTDLVAAMAPWPQEQEKARKLWSRALEGESFRIQMDFGPSEEEKSIYDLRFNPIRSPQGETVGAAHIFRDVSEQVRVQENLIESQERLRESDRRKDEYLAMLGHELRNPLAAVRSATELLKRIELDNPLLERASGVLQRQSSHMARLVDGLLEVSRIARGKIDLDPQFLDLREIVDEVLQDRSAQMMRRDLKLVRNFPTEALWVAGDHVRLVQVFDNLVGNAMKFTPAMGNIEISLTRKGNWITVRIRDNGIGMPPDTLTVIFEPFHQEAQDIARGTGGLGLGLALAKGLVELHQGSITAQSEGPGSGAEFQVRLPTVPPPGETAVRSAKIATSPSRILIVEDNADAGQTLCDLLEFQGHRVWVVESAAEALDFLQKQSVQVVLCDIGLPGMNGYELAECIRGDTDLLGLKLVALTGYGQPEDRRRTAAAGFDDHLTKPVDFQALEETLSRMTAREPT